MLTATIEPTKADLTFDGMPKHATDLYKLVKRGKSAELQKVFSLVADYVAENYHNATECRIMTTYATHKPDKSGNQLFMVVRYDGYHRAELAISHDYKIQTYLD